MDHWATSQATGWSGAPGAAPSDVVPLHEAIGVLLEREVIAHVSDGARGVACLVVLCRTAGHGARFLPRLDPGVVAHPADPLLLHDAPEAIVDRLQGPHDWLSHRDGRGVQGTDREAVPPDVGLGERAD